jgi:predicted acetyltransferase
MTFAFRRARAEDLDRLVAIHAASYPDARRAEARVRNFTANPLGPYDDLWVASSGAGAIVGHAFLFALRAWFGGCLVPVGGIASVAVAPEMRGRGAASRLVEHLHEIAFDRGDALTLLYPFRQGFYARLGYAPMSRSRALQFSPLALGRTPPELPVRAATGADRTAMAGCWEAAARAGTGLIERSERAWNAHFADEGRTWLVAEGPSDGIEGYVAWSLGQREVDGETTLVVREMATRTDAAARSLWAAVGAQRDQVQRVEAEVADDDPIAWALTDADGERGAAPSEAWHPIGAIASGPMVRMTDVARALGARGWRRPGSFVLEVASSRFEITARGGAATATLTREAPDLRTDERTLASVAFGGLRVTDAARLNLLAARDASALERTEPLLSVPPFFSPDRF